MYQSYARMLQDWGQTEKAEEKLNEAITMFKGMGMEWDLVQAEQMCAG